MRVLNYLFLLLVNAVFCMDSLKILGLFSHPGKSHSDVYLPILKALANKGHQVTVVSHFPVKHPIPNYRDVVIEENSNQLVNIIDLNGLGRSRTEYYLTVLKLAQYGYTACKTAFTSKSVSDFAKSNETFDVIIAEFFNSDCFLGFVHKFKAPVIGISTCTIMPWTSIRLGNPTHPAYIPNNLMDYSDRLTFLERVENTVTGLFNQLVYDQYVNGNDEILARQFFGQDMPPLKQLIYNASLLLVNTHFSLNLPRPLVPHIIEIGGVHLGKVKKLPNNIEKWLNESTHGVIYFSLGSMIKGHTFPEEKRHEFLRAFGRLPQRVLWKWENDSMPGKPNNVMIQKWMPQFDILCHPNVKAFISHTGLLGTTEAVHCGVPVIAMPQYGDQYTNAKALEANGGGIILDWSKVNEENIYNSLKTILDSNFKTKAEELSARFKDRPLSPLDTAIYWVEYVARHKGTSHMRTAAVDMPFYQYFLLDVMAFLVAVSLVFFATVFYMLRYIVKQFPAKNATKAKTN